jgi:hypothetical protein
MLTRRTAVRWSAWFGQFLVPGFIVIGVTLKDLCAPSKQVTELWPLVWRADHDLRMFLPS